MGPVVDEICEHAYQFGLDNAELNRLIELVTVKTELDQSNATSLIKNLYPSSPIPVGVVTRVVNSLGHAKLKPSAATQVALVRWLTAVHDMLENTTALSGLYSVLFSLLDMISLRFDSWLPMETESLGLI
jgi:centromere protein I